MNHLKSVQILDQQRSHWITKTPLGNHVEGDAEITAGQKNELICWRSLPDADIPNQSCVSFYNSDYEVGTAAKATTALVRLVGWKAQ